jgi:hypothetical protein
VTNQSNKSGPAFPCTPDQWNQGFCGISVRDYLAAQAMQALIAKMPLHDREGEHGIHTPVVEDIHQVRKDIAQSAYDYADAMLEARQ